MTSLAEDVKLSACERHPSLFSLSFDFVCLFFRLGVCHPSLGANGIVFLGTLGILYHFSVGVG
jgi:hypothetical protein